MTSRIKTAILLSIFFAFAFHGKAEENIDKAGKRVVSDALKEKAAGCSAASAQTDLDVNNVRTTLLNGGDMWWDLNDAKYEVPKVSPPGSSPSVHSLFAGSIWVGGIDPGGNLKVAAQTYRQNGNDYWPGPLDQNASVNQQTCTNYDRFWEISGKDVDKIIAESDQGNSTVPQSEISSDILHYPAKGNTNAQGTQGTTINVTEDLAPFKDVDGDGLYDPTQGDYPVINNDCEVFADQMIFWVFNDKGNIHTETGGQAIGLEVKATAFAFSTSDEVNNMTFYRYQISNESSSRLNNAYMGQWVDPDLGCFNDDYVGCDTTRDLGIVYNGDPVDEDCASKGYGENPPLLGVDYFQGPTTTGGDELGMSSFLYYNNDFSVTGNPETAIHYYNYLSGLWKDGSPFTFGGNGFGGSQEFPYMFPSDPDDNSPNAWSECSEGNTKGDRRFLQSSGPFTLLPGAVNEIITGVTWVRPSSQTGCSADFDVLRRADDRAQSLFDACFDLIDRPDAPSLSIREMDEEIVIKLFNEETSNNFKENYESVDPDAALAAEFDSADYDTTYNFQGYKLYQLKNAQVSAEELDDPSKARLIEQVDVEDNVDRIVNWKRDASLEAFIPQLKVDGNNDGVRHTFRVTEDRFAEGDRSLINHETYYFAAIAYAHNNFKKFSYDTENFADPEGQDQPYLQSSSNYQVYSAIPHKPDAGRGGTVVNAEYGDGVQITRIEGQGNGGNNLGFTDQTIENILSSDNNAYDEITYKENEGPVEVKVVDPLAMKDAEFRLYLQPDTTVANNDSLSELSENARWYLVDQTRNDTIFSRRNIDRSYEQVIRKTNDGGNVVREYGISVNIKQVVDPGVLEDEPPFEPVDKANGFISAEAEFEDPQEQWITGVQDQDGTDFFNWIRSGKQKECNLTRQCANNSDQNDYKGFYDDYYKVFNYASSIEDSVRFRDPNESYEDLVDGTFAPYCLAANFGQKECLNSCGAMDPPHYTNGPAFPRTEYGDDNAGLDLPSDPFNPEDAWNDFIPENTLQDLNSVNIVLTDDKSKWTRSPVLELGERNEFTIGATRKGQLRMHPSIDSSGNVQAALSQGDELNTSTKYVFIGKDPGSGPRIKIYEPGKTDSVSFQSGEIIDLSFSTTEYKFIGEGDLYELSDIGMGYFPGYAVNLETGERLNIMFGEASSEPGANGNDMIWNPTSQLQGSIPSQEKTAIFGGKHHIYVHNSRYDGGEAIRDTLRKHYSHSDDVPEPIRTVHDSIMWVSMPILDPEHELKSYEEGLIPNDATVRLRVNKPYEKYAVNGDNDGYPLYEFSTEGLGVDTNQTQVAKDALDLIKVVPNPYYAFSSYENSQVDNEVKITNLPSNCTVTIYSINGDLIRRYERNVSPDTSPGTSTEKQNFDNTLAWDLRNFKNVPISSGVYLIHVEADGVGEKVVKWFGVMRPIDLDSF